MAQIKKRAQKAIENDPDVLLRVGMVKLPLSFKSKPGIHVEVPVNRSNPLKTQVLVDGWRIFDKDLTTKEGIEISSKMQPMLLRVSKKAPNAVMRKSHGNTEKEADAVLALLRRYGAMIDKSNPEQWDRASDQPIGDNADRLFWFEDMRIHRNQVVEDQEVTIKIASAIHGMIGDEKKLRDTLFLIGEQPDKDDNATEMYFILIKLLIKDPTTKARKLFVDYVLDPSISKKDIDLVRFVNKAIAFGVILEERGFYTYQNKRMGADETEVVQHLTYDTDTLTSIKVQMAAIEGNGEDDAQVKGMAASVNGSADELKAIAWVSDKLKSSGLSGNPARTLNSVNTLGDAVSKYNELAQKADLPKSEWLTEDAVLNAIK